mgnify:CR=1 FL=1
MHSLEKKLIKTELRQRREEGCDVTNISERITKALEEKAPDHAFQALYDELLALSLIHI